MAQTLGLQIDRDIGWYGINGMYARRPQASPCTDREIKTGRDKHDVGFRHMVRRRCRRQKRLVEIACIYGWTVLMGRARMALASIRRIMNPVPRVSIQGEFVTVPMLVRNACREGLAARLQQHQGRCNEPDADDAMHPNVRGHQAANCPHLRSPRAGHASGYPCVSRHNMWKRLAHDCCNALTWINMPDSLLSITI